MNILLLEKVSEKQQQLSQVPFCDETQVFLKFGIGNRLICCQTAVNGTSFFLVVISAVDAATDICLYFILLIMPSSALL